MDEEWKARALRAERALWLINREFCQGDAVYSEHSECVPEDHHDLGDAIYAAAGLSLDLIVTPDDIARRLSDVRPKAPDRMIFEVRDFERTPELRVYIAARSVHGVKPRVMEWLAERYPKETLGDLTAMPCEPAGGHYGRYPEAAMRRELLAWDGKRPKAVAWCVPAIWQQRHDTVEPCKDSRQLPW